MREVWQLWKPRCLPPSLPCQVGSCLFFFWPPHPGNWKERFFDNVRYPLPFLLFCVISKRSVQSTILAVNTATILAHVEIRV